MNLFMSENLFCLKDFTNYGLQGQVNDDIFEELVVSFKACYGGNSCKELSEIESYLSGKEVRVLMIDQSLNPFSEGVIVDEISEMRIPFIPSLR